MALPPETLDLIRSFEGYLKPIGNGYVKPYLCPANVATIGWGTTRWPDGRRVSMSDAPISRERAVECFNFDMEAYARGVDAASAGARWHPLMRGACVSFAYNCGVGAWRASTLRRKVLAGDWDDVPREFAKWNKGGGRILPGLVRRRTAEAGMFMRGVQALRKGESPAPAEVPQSTQVAKPTINKDIRAESWAVRLMRYILRR